MFFYQTILKHSIMYGINIATSIRFLYPPLADFKLIFHLVKPDSWLLLAKCVRNTFLSAILSENAGHQFASKNQQPGFYINGTLK